MTASGELPIVFLPGLLCDAAVWPHQVAALQDRGPSSIADYGAIDSLPGMAAHVLASAPEQFAVVGHSMGGRVAFEIWRAARGRVRGLALLDTGYHPLAAAEAGERERAGRMALLKIARLKGMRAMAKEWAQGMVHPARLKDEVLMNAILDMIERKTPDIYEAQINALLARPDAGPLMPEIDCPTLVLCGREDNWSPVRQHEEMARAIRGSTLAIVENCGHMCTMEQPDEISRHLRAWLAPL